MAESDVVAIEPRPSTIINAFGGDNGGLIHKADARLGDFADFFEQMGEVAGVLEEAGLSSDKVRVRAWGLVCIPRTSRRCCDAMLCDVTWAGALRHETSSRSPL